ncbi:MAG: hypothetical protein COA78_31835 [Blastopirellula sp.]|nr:MAG: hypothetical protein COA78_31835 [Blastopirellula sp.]
MQPHSKKSRAHFPKSKSDHLLGWDTGDSGHIGFTGTAETKPIWYSGTGHQLTLGVTGSGKAVSSAIPQALSYQGSLICFDPKGEIAQVTRRYREEILGQQIAVLAPFANGDGGFNPFDLAKFVDDSDYDFASSLASIIGGSSQPSSYSRSSTNDEFWQNWGVNLLTGVIGAAMEKRLSSVSINAIPKILKADDVTYNLAVLLDTNKPSEAFYREIAAFLQLTETTRSGVLATSQSYFRGFSGDGVMKMLEKTTFDLEGFINGTKPTTIYITIPPEKLVSHSRLVCLLFGSLILALFSRKFIPTHKTLIQLDEAAALGTFEPLRTLLTLGRGQGVICHSYWQDLSQIKNNFFDWQTILNNHNVIRILGASNYIQATELAGIYGIPAKKLLQQTPQEQALILNGEFQCCQRVNYLQDAFFAGLFDPNPRYIDPYHTEDNRPEKGKGTISRQHPAPSPASPNA